VRVLVTGAFGFVGHAVVRALLEEGHEVVAASSRADRRWPAPGKVEVVQANVLEPSSLTGAVAEVDGICHLAALTRVRESFDMPERYAAVNVTGTRNLLAALAERPRPVPFVHASSAVVYGAPTLQPIAENCAAAPSSPYAETKLAADQAICDAAETGRVAGISLRIFNASGAVDGHGDPDLTRIIPKSVAVAAGLAPEVGVNGDGSAIRDFVHVADVASAFAAALTGARPGVFTAYNVGATPASVAEIIAMTQSLTGRDLPVQNNPPAKEAPDLRADTSRIRAELGWKPLHSSLEQIINDAWIAVARIQ